MNYIEDIYNYFFDNETGKTDYSALRSGVISDYKTYKDYLATYDIKKYNLKKANKFKSDWYKSYLDTRELIDDYIKNADNPCFKEDYNYAYEAFYTNLNDDYAKYYLFRLLIEETFYPFVIPSNNNLFTESRKLLNYFAQINHKNIITGQHTQTVGQEELTHIKSITGHYPKLVGYELLACSQNINPNSDSECLEEVEDNKGTLQVALYDKNIITFTWHMFSPLYGVGKTFYEKNTTFDVREIIEDKTSPEYNAFINELDHMSKLLKHFSEIKKPILFRPFHEADGTWFWWGKYGANYASELFKITYNYFVKEKELNNLIWVWNSIDAYPGDEYVDIISVDCYGKEKDAETCYLDKYNELITKVSNKKLVALAECDVIPDYKLLKENNFPYIYYMTWSKEFCLTEKYNSNEKLKKFYKEDGVIKE